GHADNPPQADFIELFNRGGQALDLGGCFLSDDPDTNKFAFPPNTVIQARGFLSVDSSQLGFSVKSEGETLYFRNPGQRVIDAVRFSGQANNLSFERVPDGGPAFRLLASPTPGGTNGGPYHNDIVINELMYHPASGNDDEQYVELYNRGKNPVNLGGWKFVSGINFTIPANTLLSPNGYLAVARNADRLRAMYTNLGPGNVVGNFGGSLAGSGERVALAMPSSWLVTNVDGRIGTNTIHAVVSEVTYHNGGRWGQWSAGGGSSLELIDPESDTTLAANWADSDETGKAPWTTVVTTGVLDNGFTPADQLQVLLQGAGECLIDDVQVLNASKVNLIANSSFETDARNWTAEGTEDQSSLDSTQGFNSGKSYRIRAVERGDNQVNRVRVPLTSNLPSGSTATIQAKIRWLKGAANVLLRLRGDWLEAVGAMTLPPNPGTPGAPNSRRVANAGPAISEVIHTPVLPADRQAVVVTARVNDPDGVANVTLKYRLDPATTYTTVAMKDDGTGGDSIAGDGVYSGTIPAQATGALIAFYVQAADRATAPTTTIFPNDAPKRECLVRFGEAQPTGNFPVYRIWMTQATLNTWNSRSRLNNTPLDVTFVLGNQRVIYNSRALFAGSPYISPGYCGAACGMCGYTLSFPEDDRLLGDTDFVLDWPGGHGGESTAMQEEMAYWIAARIGLPTCHRYIIRLHVNGVTDEQRGGVFEAVNQPSGDFVKAWTGSNNGDMFKVDRSFEFNDGGGLISDAMPTLQVFTTTGGAKKQARYRWSWNKRATDTPNNYTNIFNLVDAANAASPEPYTSAFESLVDMEEWMGIFAVEHIINNFDSWGHDIGKNMYIYKPYDGKWQLYMFDLDWLMLAAPRGPGNYTASSGPLFNSADPVVTRVYNHPPFRRAYFRAVQAAVDGPLAAENCNPLMDAKYSSLVANGVRYCDGSSLSSPSAVKTWFKDRRTALLTQLAKVAADFTVSGGDTFTTNASPLQLAGTAPVTVKTIQVNGIDWPVTWTTVTNWVLQVPLTRATSPLAITGLDRDGNPVSGAGKNVVANYTGAASALPVVLINEWMAANTTAVADISSGSAKYDDWFELYNPAGTTADLAGYYLTDTLDNKTQFKIPAGYPIPAGGHLLVWADNEPGQNVAGQPDLHVNFQLSAKGESIGLFAPDGSTIDAVTFGPQSDDVSQGRCPDGSTNIMAMPNFTPRAANNCAPAAPSPKLGPVTLKDGQLVLGWEATPGASYRVEYKDDLGAAQWTPLGSTVTAPGASVAISIDLSGATQRFFRVRVQ
ncbi:MAG TPA: lamin tail domain-containing protein, partial [Verrucomicrobiae bacterium]|nr:lamin tail domain-containing protein [Verrucomicrobiae bacterium]